MFAGYLNKRSAPISPPPMQRVYSVLWGTMLFDYENEEEAKQSMCPKLVTEILGISEWDGKGRANSYPFGFLLVTHTGGTYYVSVATVHDRDEWIVHVKRALECVFANSEVLPFKPSKIIQNRPPLASNMVCPRSNHTLSSSICYCRSCGVGYYSSEYVSEASTMLQIGLEDQEKVCLDCKNAQLCVLWFKSLNYVHVMTMHDLSPVVQKEINKFKNTFKLTRRLSGRLEMAAELMTNGGISVEEFEELRIVDHAYRRELVFEEATRLKRAVEAFGEDMQTIIGILMNPHLTDKGGRASYYNIILRILEIADNSPDLIDFYFPQIIQVHLQETRVRTMEALIKVDLLQQALLVISQKYPALGLKLAWSLLASVGDYAEKRITQAQYAACMCLLLQLEMAVTGLVSSIADVPTCRLLSKVFKGAAHQQQEIGFEISALFLVRRRLQEMYDEDEADRQARARRLYGGVDEVDGQPVDPSEKKGAAAAAATAGADGGDKANSGKRQSTRKNKKSGSNSNTSSSSSAGVIRRNHETTCKELLYQLGVGQRNNNVTSPITEEEFSYVSDADSDDEPDAESNGILETGTAAVSPGGAGDKVAVGSPGRKHAKRPAPAAAEGIIVDDDDDDESDTGHADGSGRESNRLSTSFRHDLDVNNQQWSGFAEQLDFIDRLAEVVDGLRFVDRPQRTEALVRELNKWNEQPLKFLGWDPTTIAGEPHYRITRIITEECRVFRTKARAPSLIVCEVVRDDLISQGHYANKDESGFRRSVDRVGSRDNTPLKKSQGPGNVPHGRVNQQIDDLVDSNMSQAIATLHRHQSHDDINVSTKISKGIDAVGSSINKLTSVISANSLTELVLPSNPSPSTVSVNSKNTSNGSTTGAAGATTAAGGGGSNAASASASQKKRNPPVAMPRRKTSTFLSSNRLAVGAEDMMRSTVSGGSPSPSVKLSAISLQGRNSFNDLTQFASTGGASEASGGGGSNGNLSPVVRLSQSGRFKAVSGGSATMEDLDELTESAAQITVNDDGVSVSSRSTENDSASVKSGTNSSVAESSQGQVTKKVLTSAQKLLQAGKIDAKEYEQLLACDMQYHEETAREEAHIVKSRVENVLGESWQAKKEKYLGAKLFHHGSYEEGTAEEQDWNSEAHWPAWDLRCFIVKSNDDLRQEVCCLQLMQLCKEVFDHFGLSNMLWLKPYRIISTSCNTGVVQVLTDAISLDALKKTPGFANLNNYFKKTYDSSPERLAQAKYNFAASLAAYSLFSYILLIKDRHNGNLLLDVDGHIMHIDFGFLLSIAPGGSFSVESAPFKLTEEMVEVLGGLDSPLFGQFVNAFTKGFIALQANAENIVGALQVLSLNSTFPCFAGKQSAAIIDKLRGRFRTELSVGDAVKHCLDLITNSYGNYGTRQYDTFQYYTNGIFP